MSRRTAATDPAGSIARWLLSGPALLRSGADAGGVLGWTSASGEGRFIYPEICGYHLSWLAALAHGSPERHDQAAACAGPVLAWLEDHEASHGRFVTRVHAAPREDWRNLAEFTFDLGMILRGLDATATAFPTLARPHLRRGCLSRILASTTPDGVLGSHRLLPGASPDALPHRWSTTTGPHLIKVAAALVGAPDMDVDAVGRATIWHHLATLLTDAPLPPPHPTLYAVEGLLQAGLATENASWLEGARTVWLRFIEDATTTGALPARGHPPEPAARADVLAQTLRTGKLLAGQARLPHDATTQMEWMERTLVAAVRPDGGVPFHYASQGLSPQRNTWVAHFAHQALTLGTDPCSARWLV